MREGSEQRQQYRYGLAKFGASLVAGSIICMCMAGCSDWERSTYQTLSATHAVINQAQADYEARTIPRTAGAYAAINEAKAVQTAAVEAMATYESAKYAAAGKDALTAQQNAVTAILLQLPPLIAAIKNLYAPTQPTVKPMAYLHRRDGPTLALDRSYVP
jgi:hypothetical protein